MPNGALKILPLRESGRAQAMAGGRERVLVRGGESERTIAQQPVAGGAAGVDVSARAERVPSGGRAQPEVDAEL